MEIIPADAASNEVWSFLTLVVLPDIAVWRYPQRTEERLLGRPRNVFRRLWWRAFVLGAEADSPPAVLGEDQLVAIMERPTIGGDRRTARAFGKAVITATDKKPNVSPMFLMSDAAKRLIRLTPFLCLGGLSDDAIQEFMRQLVDRSTASLS